MNHSHIGPKPIIFAVLMALALAGAALALLFSPVQAKENSAPAKPTGLTATASYDSVTLTWDDPQDDSITGYVILRRNRDTDALGQFTELVNDTGSAATAYTDGSVAAGTPYTYRIKAINAHGTSERSRWFDIDTPSAPVPDKPTGLTATASHDQVVLTWDDPNDDSITGYVILRRDRDTDAEGQFTELVNDTGSAATGYTDDTVAAETPYTYRIKAINGHGVSERSRWFHIDTPAAPTTEPPAAPTGLTAEVSHDSVTLTWDDPNDDSVTGYVILRRNRDTDAQGQFTELVADTGSAATAYTDDTVAAGTPYTYRIKAINEHGTSERSRWAHVETTAAPTPEGAPEQSVSEGDTDLPNDNSTPGRVAVGGSATGAVGTDGDQDRFAVELEAGRTYQFDLTGSPGGGGTLPDTFFRAIYNSEGQYQPDSYNDDFDGGRDSRVTFTPTESGTYYARVSGDRDETGSYTLRVTDVALQEAPVVPESPDVPGDITTTGKVDVGGWVTGNIDPTDDNDWFRVELEAGTRYQIDMEGAPTGRGTLTDPLLFNIRDATGTGIPRTGDGNSGVGNNARMIFTLAADGTYFVWVRGGAGSTGAYTLSVIELGANGASEADADLPDDTTTTGEVEVGGSVTGNIGRTNDVDRFSVELEAGKTYRIDMEGEETNRGTLEDPRLSGIFDADGNEILGNQNDNGGQGNNSRLLFTPTATGAYYVAAGAMVYHVGTYTLSVEEAN